MGGVKSGQRFRERIGGNTLRQHERQNDADAAGLGAEAQKHIGQFLVHGDQPVKAPQHKPAQGPPPSRVPLRGLGVPTGMERKHAVAARKQRARKRQQQQPQRQCPADMQMDNAGLERKQQPQDLPGALRIENAGGIVPAKAGEIDHAGRVPPFPQQAMDSYKIGLHSAHWGRKRTQLKHAQSHFGFRATRKTPHASRSLSFRFRNAAESRGRISASRRSYSGP